jgi:uncharacterized protein (DUF1697 family)
MALVVFLRGVNVGGHRTFRPAALARELAAFDAVNVGAAGTLVIRKPIGPVALRAELLRRLPFETELMICRGRDFLDIVCAAPFPDEPSQQEARRFVSVLAKGPRSVPRLPISQPAGDKWQVKIIGVSGTFALSLWRRLAGPLVYPNEVVEKNLGVPATTRNWNTISTICKILAVA